MKKYDVYGIGNALADIEFTVSPQLLHKLKIDKGVMTLIDESR
ncbi:MAG: adenosine kinase, partial [Okeania sp. SIO2D1]|nr:adenosine kinase [Okeania sp. SIO2D1]